MAKEIKATRSELLRIKKLIKLAKSGHSLLKKKRDGLILELFEVLKKAKTLRQELVEEYKKGLHAVTIARALEGDIKVRSIALSVQQRSDIQITKKNVMGVKVLKIESGGKKGEVTASRMAMPASISDAADSYQKVVEKVMRAAEVETTVRKLLQEIEKTMRRVNALEYVVIPKQQHVKSFISLRLEEIEREGIFGMKRIKAKAKSS